MRGVLPKNNQKPWHGTTACLESDFLGRVSLFPFLRDLRGVINLNIVIEIKSKIVRPPVGLIPHQRSVQFLFLEDEERLSLRVNRESESGIEMETHVAHGCAATHPKSLPRTAFKLYEDVHTKIK